MNSTYMVLNSTYFRHEVSSGSIYETIQSLSPRRHKGSIDSHRVDRGVTYDNIIFMCHCIDKQVHHDECIPSPNPFPVPTLLEA